MKYHPFITATFIVAAISLLGLVTVPAQSAEQSHSAHQVAEAPGTPPTNTPAANPFANEPRVEADTPTQPVVVGKDWPQRAADSQV